MFGRTYVIFYFDPRVFVLVMWSTPSQIPFESIFFLYFQKPYWTVVLIINKHQLLMKWGITQSVRAHLGKFPSGESGIMRKFYNWRFVTNDSDLVTSK